MRKYELSRKGKFLIFGANSILAIVLMVQYICMDYNLMQMFGTVCVYMGVTILSEFFIQGQMRNAASLAAASIAVFPVALPLSMFVDLVVRGAFFAIECFKLFLEFWFSFSLDWALFENFASYCCHFLDDTSRCYCIAYCVCLPLFAAAFNNSWETK